MKYLRLYKNINEYYEDTASLSGDDAYVSYVLTNFQTGDETIYGVREKPAAVASVMWIDDYPDDMDIPETYGFNTMDEYLANLVETGGAGTNYDGANPYYYTNETIEYNGNTYYLWEYDGECNSLIHYALTSTIDYNTLYDLSIESDTSNRNCPIYTFLYPDKTQSEYVPNYDDENYVLLKVEKDEE